MTKHEAMKSYVQEKVEELAKGLVSFNYANDSPFSISFLTNYSGKVVKKYIRAADKEYGFSIQVKKVENLQNMPSLASVDWENMKAQYVIRCRVLYIEKER